MEALISVGAALLWPKFGDGLRFGAALWRRRSGDGGVTKTGGTESSQRGEAQGCGNFVRRPPHASKRRKRGGGHARLGENDSGSAVRGAGGNGSRAQGA